jgi:hypothetical protein
MMLKTFIITLQKKSFGRRWFWSGDGALLILNCFFRFREFLELDVSLPQNKVKEVSEVAVAHINAAVVELRRLFLVEDLVDSIKFGVLLWTLTYLGAWFNGMTLIIIGER